MIVAGKWAFGCHLSDSCHRLRLLSLSAYVALLQGGSVSWSRLRLFSRGLGSSRLIPIMGRHSNLKSNQIAAIATLCKRGHSNNEVCNITDLNIRSVQR